MKLKSSNEKRILDFIRKSKNNFLTITEISKKLNISYSTAHKWVTFLKLKGLVKTNKHGYVELS